MTATVVRQFDSQVQEIFRLAQKPTLQALGYALRHRDVWPDDFSWNYSRVDCCAMGLAARLWPKRIHRFSGMAPTFVELQKVFNLSTLAACAIFFGSEQHSLLFKRQETTPEMVADVIDHYLARGEFAIIVRFFYRNFFLLPSR
jgi:hypothetical protein